MELYHGTARVNLPAIEKVGLVPKAGKGGDTWAKAQGWNMAKALTPERNASVFLTTDKRAALYFARIAQVVNHDRARPVVLKLEVPDSLALEPDEENAPDMPPTLYRYRGTVRPGWIKSYTPVVGYIEPGKPLPLSALAALGKEHKLA